MAHFTDDDGNQITQGGKLVAGSLLLFFFISSLVLIIGLMPDQIPSPQERIPAYYKLDLFRVRLVGAGDSSSVKTAAVDSVVRPTTSTSVTRSSAVDSNLADSGKVNVAAPVTAKKVSVSSGADEDYSYSGLIHLHTLLLILVALAGFLGNMIHIATSFTTFIGVGRFKRSWYLWYVVKPFIGAALAIAIYFVLCGGFLNSNPGSINIYGMLTIALLTGLFTDRATLKLEEVFEVLLKPKEERSDGISTGLRITGVEPRTLKKGIEQNITIKGENLPKDKLKFLIGEVEVEAEVTTDRALINYNVPATLGEASLILKVKDGKERIVYQTTLAIE